MTYDWTLSYLLVYRLYSIRLKDRGIQKKYQKFLENPKVFLQKPWY